MSIAPDINFIEKGDPTGKAVGASVYLMGEVKFAGVAWQHFLINLADEANGSDWRETVVTVSMSLGGGNNGGDHWGWPGGGFAGVHHGSVSSTGWFNYYLQAGVGSSTVVGGVFRWIRRGVHGASGRTWRY